MNEKEEPQKKKTVPHSVLLKAVNHPVRRTILELINSKEEGITKQELMNQLLENDVIPDDKAFNYNISFLLQADCVREEAGATSRETRYFITQSGKVVEYYE
ncbi:MAG: hypothetical protein ACTSUT_14235 [Promethearchaeota archaeon]